MVTATNKARPTGPLARRSGGVSELAPTEFQIFADNGGNYHWRLLAGNGATLARSVTFVSYQDAEQAARQVRDGARSARLARAPGEARPVDLVARRQARAKASTPAAG